MTRAENGVNSVYIQKQLDKTTVEQRLFEQRPQSVKDVFFIPVISVKPRRFNFNSCQAKKILISRVEFAENCTSYSSEIRVLRMRLRSVRTRYFLVHRSKRKVIRMQDRIDLLQS